MTHPKVTTVGHMDPVWATVREEAEALVEREPLMASLVHAVVLHHQSLESVLSYRIAQKLSSDAMPQLLLRELIDQAMSENPGLSTAMRADLVAVRERDPACHRYIQPILYFKSFLAIQAYRVAHHLWLRGRKDVALFIQMRVSEAFAIDIHPNARIGKGLMIDHGHSIVIGETAVVGDDCSLLHGVTLGGTGKEDGDRHPKIGNGVLIGAGASILGNISIGDCCRVAAGSVVLKHIPANKTVAGVPARVVGEAGCDRPSSSMNQMVEPEDKVPDC